MAKTCIVAPAAGRRVINPATMKPLPEKGELVEWGTFWIRRRNVGDIVEVGEGSVSAVAKTTAKPAKPATGAAKE